MRLDLVESNRDRRFFVFQTMPFIEDYQIRSRFHQILIHFCVIKNLIKRPLDRINEIYLSGIYFYSPFQHLEAFLCAVSSCLHGLWRLCERSHNKWGEHRRGGSSQISSTKNKNKFVRPKYMVSLKKNGLPLPEWLGPLRFHSKQTDEMIETGKDRHFV